MGQLRIRRVYDTPSDDDGYRVLVDRLWPRGVSRDRARLDEWRRRRIIPADNWYARSTYAERLKAAGFVDVEVRDITDNVFTPNAEYVRERCTALLADPNLKSSKQKSAIKWHMRLTEMRKTMMDYVITVAVKPGGHRSLYIATGRLSVHPGPGGHHSQPVTSQPRSKYFTNLDHRNLPKHRRNPFTRHRREAIRSSYRAAPDATRRWSHDWQSGGPMTVAKPSSHRSHHHGGRQGAAPSATDNDYRAAVGLVVITPTACREDRSVLLWTLTPE